jgi:alpha-glucosidase
MLLKFSRSALMLVLGLAFIAGCSGLGSSTSTEDLEDTGIYEADDNGTSFSALDTPSPDARSLGSDSADWYKDAVFYHLWMSAFCDGNTSIGVNGEGDFAGIISKLDYLQNDLGVTAIWLSPFYKSVSTSENRHNYDVTDFNTVNPIYGTNADLYDLVEELHARGMKVIFDWVPNLVSSSHPWFTLSKSDTTNSKRNWFVWRSAALAGWNGFDSSSDFYYNSSNGLYYYSVYYSGMPDLNYNAPGVRNAMGNTIEYWLNAGFDGMRVDSAKYIYEDFTASSTTGWLDQQKTFTHYQEIRSKILDNYANFTDANGKSLYKFMVAENWTSDQTNLLRYMSDGGNAGFNMTLNFPFASASASLDTTTINSLWSWETSTVIPAGGWMGEFTSNHDNCTSRPMSAFDGDIGKVRAQAALQLTGIGTPFIYYGNEIGMTGVMGTDTDLRTPISWSEATAQKATPSSILNWHKALITARKNRVSLRRGSYSLVTNSNGIFAFERTSGSERTLVVANINTASKSPVLTLATAPGASSTIIGTENLTISGNSITVSEMKPNAVRVIALGDSTQTSSIGDLDYTPPVVSPYLRGTFTNWGPGTKMTDSNGDGIFSLTLTLTSGSKEFKFFYAPDTLDSGWMGVAQMTYDPATGGDATFTRTGTDNIVFSAAAGTYTFYINPTTRRYSVDAP